MLTVPAMGKAKIGALTGPRAGLKATVGFTGAVKIMVPSMGFLMLQLLGRVTVVMACEFRTPHLACKGLFCAESSISS